MPNSIYADDWEDWEVDPSTRESVHVWTKSSPVNVTLATPGTAETLYTVNPTKPTVNLATNPSFETGDPPTGYTAVGSTLSQSAVVARSGTNSMLVNPDNAASGEGFYLATISLGAIPSGPARHLVVSFYVQDNVSSGNGVLIRIADSSGVAIASSATVTLTNAWQRATVSIDLNSRAAASYRVYGITATQHNTNFYIDDMQVEILQQSSPTTYCDGAQGLFYEWDGTAHASISRRRSGISIVRGYTLYTTRDTYFAEDITASSTTGRLIRAGSDFWEDFPLDIYNRISFINVNAGERPQITGVIRGVHKGRHA